MIFQEDSEGLFQDGIVQTYGIISPNWRGRQKIPEGLALHILKNVTGNLLDVFESTQWRRK